MTAKGSRVIAIQSAKDGIVRSYGAGVYAGDFPLPDDVDGFNCGWDNPRIDLDSGDTVWGCESWWGPEEEVKQRFPPDWKWETVTVEQARAEA